MRRGGLPVRVDRRFALNELLVVVLVIGILFALFTPAMATSRDAARRAQCWNNLGQMALAAANYHLSLGVFPFGVGGGGPPGPGRIPRWSSHSQLLMTMGQTQV